MHMMISDITTVALIGEMLTIMTVIGGGFYFTGRITKNIEILTKITEDHETRIRHLERGD